jgi:hypothetical protein
MGARAALSGSQAGLDRRERHGRATQASGAAAGA